MENFNGFIILFDNDNRDINCILSYVLNLFHYDENGLLMGETYDKFTGYLSDTDVPFKEMDFYYNGRYGNEDKDQYSFINEDKFNSIRLKIKSYIETYVNSMHEINDIMKDTTMNISKFEKYIKEKNSVVKTLKNKKFDILIYAIENGASKDIIEYIIDHYSYENLTFGIKIKPHTNDIESITKYNDYIDRLPINHTNKNLKYHYAKMFSYPEIHSYNIEVRPKKYYHKTPLFTALSKNKFTIADLLIEKGLNVNYYMKEKEEEEDIIYLLSIENVLNCENLKYILNHGYNPPKSFINDIKIYHWIKSFQNDYLEIYLNYYGIGKKENSNKSENTPDLQLIKDQYYLFSIFNENYNSILILLNYDNDNGENKNENNILYKLFIYFNYDKEKLKKIYAKN
ncbi:hypothetical protein PIROE2DRAFT_59417 [Piromyces sp. E2]|nr:hypothetical protein PIROE2DRAFT_59417 [Piromyces sp. E2]|eukprot:OUM66386.1 hypothetical protein PIROE2DRAFT_59417 [Piromyces sp. E2]